VIAKLGALLNSVAAEVAADSIETKRVFPPRVLRSAREAL